MCGPGSTGMRVTDAQPEPRLGISMLSPVVELETVAPPGHRVEPHVGSEDDLLQAGSQHVGLQSDAAGVRSLPRDQLRKVSHLAVFGDEIVGCGDEVGRVGHQCRQLPVSRLDRVGGRGRRVALVGRALARDACGFEVDNVARKVLQLPLVEHGSSGRHTVVMSTDAALQLGDVPLIAACSLDIGHALEADLGELRG